MCGGGGGGGGVGVGGGRTIYMPISTEGSGTPTTRPKTGSPVKGHGSRGGRSFNMYSILLFILLSYLRYVLIFVRPTRSQFWILLPQVTSNFGCVPTTTRKSPYHRSVSIGTYYASRTDGRGIT